MTDSDYVQKNSAVGDRDNAETSNEQGRTGRGEQEGSNVASVASWKHAVLPCTVEHQNQDDAALETVLAKSRTESSSENDALWNPHTRCHCVQRVNFDTAAPTAFWKDRDSWSADWSEAGFTRFPCGLKACSVVSEAVSPSGVWRPS